MSPPVAVVSSPPSLPLPLPSVEVLLSPSLAVPASEPEPVVVLESPAVEVSPPPVPIVIVPTSPDVPCVEVLAFVVAPALELLVPWELPASLELVLEVSESSSPVELSPPESQAPRAAHMSAAMPQRPALG